MSYLALARKWRPRRFSELIGQPHVVRALSNALERQRLHPALLFTGTRGVGKTTIARIIAKSLNCERGVSADPCGECSSCREVDEGRCVDLIEVDAASRTRVDDTRELLDNVQYAPARGRYKVYLVDEVHMLSTHSFNALLKTLEEPPPHVQFLLATTDPQKLPVTILSRCLQFNLKRLSRRQIAAHLEDILRREEVQAEPGALALLAAAADGSMRDALSLLDQALAFSEGELRESEIGIMLGTIGRHHLDELLHALGDGDPSRLVAGIRALDEQVPDYEGVLDELAAALQRIALLQVLPDAPLEEDGEDRRRALADLAARLTPEDVQLYYQMTILGRRDLQWAPDPRTGFEMTLLRMLAFRPADGESMPPPKRAPATESPPSPAPRAAPAATESGPPQEPPSPVSPEPAPVAEPPADTDALMSAPWAETVATLKVRGVADQLARNCVPAGLSGSVLTLQMQPRYQHVFTEKAKDRLEKALRSRFGDDLRLRIKIAETTEETPAELRERQQSERQQEAEAAIAEDPHVRALGSRFGATVRPGSVAPVDEPPAQ